MVLVHHRGAAGEVGGFHADHRLGDLIGVGGLGFLYRFHPHIEADIGGFHRVVGDTVVAADVIVPLLDELVVLRRVDTLEVIPGGQVADQRRGVDAGQFLFAHGERDHRNVGGVHALVGEFFIERHVGVAVDGGDHCGLLAFTTEFLDARHDRLPVGMTEWGVVDHDVVLGDALGLQVGLEDLVGGTRVDIVGAGENEALHAQVVEQVVHRRDRLLVGRGAGVEDVLGGFLAFVLHRVEQQAVEFFHHRQHGFTGHRGPAAEDHVHLVLGDQLAGFLREQRPVGGGVHHHRLQLLAHDTAFFVLLFDHHQHGVFQCGFADRHGAGQGVQHTHLDGVRGHYQAAVGDSASGDAGLGQSFQVHCHFHGVPLSLFRSVNGPFAAVGVGVLLRSLDGAHFRSHWKLSCRARGPWHALHAACAA